MLDNLKFRKLENGYTVKYHLVFPSLDDKPVIKFGGEIYVKDRAQLREAVVELIDKHLESE